MFKSLSYYLIFSLFIFLSSCSDDFENQTVNRDLDSIQSIGKIKALIHYSSTSYFIYKGIPQGFEFELLSLYADHIGVELEVVPIKSIDSVFIQLNSGVADVVAANLTVTKERKEQITFTHPVISTKQVLVQRKPNGYEKMKKNELDKLLIRNIHELADKKIVVREYSSFYSELKRIKKEIRNNINTEIASGSLTAEELIAMVADGEIDYTVADKNIAMVNEWYYPNIDTRLELSSYQDIAFAVRQNSDSLELSINQWLNDFKKTKKFKSIYKKYFKNQHLVKKRVKHQYFTLVSGQISPYDDLFKKHAVDLEWDWELFAALVYQESNFNNRARGWGNSFGLMQFMPETGARFGVDTSSSPEQNIIAGVKYIKYLNKEWENLVVDKNERVKYIIASYNAGPGHVVDAFNLAEKYGKNPRLWDEVRYFLLNKSKPKYYNDEVVKSGYCKGYIACDYVDEIMERYHHYKNMTQVK